MRAHGSLLRPINSCINNTLSLNICVREVNLALRILVILRTFDSVASKCHKAIHCRFPLSSIYESKHKQSTTVLDAHLIRTPNALHLEISQHIRIIRKIKYLLLYLSDAPRAPVPVMIGDEYRSLL